MNAMVKKKQKPQRGGEKYVALLLVAIALMALLYIYFPSGGQYISSAYTGKTSAFIALTPSEVAPMHYLQYNETSPANCQTSRILINSSGLAALCTSTFTSKDPNNLSVPYSITLSYYLFNSKSNESLYISNVTQFLNTTPWPNNIVAMSNLSSYKNMSIIETTLVFMDPTPYNHVSTIYLEKNTTILSISSLSINGSNMASDQRLDSQMLYNWYLNSTI